MAANADIDVQEAGPAAATVSRLNLVSRRCPLCAEQSKSLDMLLWSGVRSWYDPSSSSTSTLLPLYGRSKKGACGIAAHEGTTERANGFLCSSRMRLCPAPSQRSYRCSATRSKMGRNPVEHPFEGVSVIDSRQIVFCIGSRDSAVPHIVGIDHGKDERRDVRHLCPRVLSTFRFKGSGSYPSVPLAYRSTLLHHLQRD